MAKHLSFNNFADSLVKGVVAGIVVVIIMVAQEGVNTDSLQLVVIYITAPDTTAILAYANASICFRCQDIFLIFVK